MSDRFVRRCVLHPEPVDTIDPRPGSAESISCPLGHRSEAAVGDGQEYTLFAPAWRVWDMLLDRRIATVVIELKHGPTLYPGLVMWAPEYKWIESTDLLAVLIAGRNRDGFTKRVASYYHTRKRHVGI
jgi:hypothetical protein